MITKSKSQTQKFAAKLAKHILRKSPGARASVFALSGDLGAGKTTFTQGFIKSLGVTHHVTSPTFLIVRRYELPRVEGGAKNPKNKSLPSNLLAVPYKNIFHFDLYRIHDSKEILALGFKKIISNPQNIVLIEWPERIGRAIPKFADWIYFEHGRNIKERRITISK